MLPLPSPHLQGQGHREKAPGPQLASDWRVEHSLGRKEIFLKIIEGHTGACCPGSPARPGLPNS